jgi:hypothetical protein
MDTILGYFNTSAKRWLAVLAGAVLASVVVVAHSFMEAISPEEKTVTVDQLTSSGTEQAPAKSEPTWNEPQAGHAGEDHAVVARVSPFDSKTPPVSKPDPVIRQQMVHHQADYLRTLIAAGKLPAGFGNLTKEQVDEMEKKGITIQ